MIQIRSCLCDAAILSGSAAGFAHAATATNTEASDTIQEITVTAQRRTENVQNVPITIQALTAETLNQLSVTTFNDYVKYLPNVTAPNNGPVRATFSCAASVSAPRAASPAARSAGFRRRHLPGPISPVSSRRATSISTPPTWSASRSSKVRRARCSGRRAGRRRPLHNKQTEAQYHRGQLRAGYGVTAHGDPNTDLTAVLNVPLIADTLALRAVIYNDRRGVTSTRAGNFTRKSTDLGIYYANNPGGGVPANAPVINNNAIAGRAINPVTYTGTRVEALYQINDDWNFLLSQSYQNMDSEGVFYQMPKSSDGVPLHPLEVTLFNNSYDKDKFENTAWTLNGKLGP